MQIAEAGADMKVRIRGAATSAARRIVRADDGLLCNVAWEPTLPGLATCSEDGFVALSDLEKREMLQEYVTFASVPSRPRWSPDGSCLSGRCASRKIDLFDPRLPRVR